MLSPSIMYISSVDPFPSQMRVVILYAAVFVRCCKDYQVARMVERLTYEKSKLEKVEGKLEVLQESALTTYSGLLQADEAKMVKQFPMRWIGKPKAGRLALEDAPSAPAKRRGKSTSKKKNPRKMKRKSPKGTYYLLSYSYLCCVVQTMRTLVAISWHSCIRRCFWTWRTSCGPWIGFSICGLPTKSSSPTARRQ